MLVVGGGAAKGMVNVLYNSRPVGGAGKRHNQNPAVCNVRQRGSAANSRRVLRVRKCAVTVASTSHVTKRVFTSVRQHIRTVNVPLPS